MIFYHIQAATNLAYVPTLLAFIYDERNHYLVCIDRSQQMVPAYLAELAARTPNISISFVDRVTWGGASQVDVMIRALQLFASRHEDQRFYVNLSDSDFPLWTQQEFYRYLLNSETEGRRVFMQCWQAKTPEFVQWSGKSDRASITLQARPDVQFVLDSELSWMFQSDETSPVVNAHIRASISSTEFRENKTLCLQPLSYIQVLNRTNLLGRTGFHIGRQWLIMHIDYVRSLLCSEAFFSCATILRDIFIPDESVFQTGFHAMGQPFDILEQDNCRLWRATVGVVADRNIDALRDRSAAFARKIDLKDSTGLLAWAEVLFRNEISSFRDITGWEESRFAHWTTGEQDGSVDRP